MTEELTPSNNESNEFNYKVEVILRQTNYTVEEAREKLVQQNNDHVKVIKIFLGIQEKHEPPIKSINQEIYRQLRYKMNDSKK